MTLGLCDKFYYIAIMPLQNKGAALYLLGCESIYIERPSKYFENELLESVNDNQISKICLREEGSLNHSFSYYNMSQPQWRMKSKTFNLPYGDLIHAGPPLQCREE